MLDDASFEEVKTRKSRPAQKKTPPLPSENEVRVEQRHVGWLLGSRGGVLRGIEEKTGAKVVIDQSTRGQGYSMVRFNGTPYAIKEARALVERSLDGHKAPAEQVRQTNSCVGDGSFGDPLVASDLAVPQQHVGWLLGSKGGVLRGIEEKTGAQIVIDQSTRNQGFSTARFRGNAEAVRAARVLAERSLAGHGHKNMEQSHLISKGSQVLIGDDVTSLDMTVEQQDVGWLLGSAGETVREMEHKSGAKIEVDQSTKAQGYSMMTITGAPEKVDAARDFVQKVLEKRHASNEHADVLGKQNQRTLDYTVEQRHVGWLLGSRGAVVQEMERKSGARISVDQACRDEGYSVVRIQGSAEALETARALIEGSIKKHAPKDPELVEKERIADHMFLASEGDMYGDQVELDQYLIHWLFSKDRAVVREIEHACRVEMSLDEGTSANGYSTLLIKGATLDVMAAREAIYDSILRFLASPSPSCNAEETSFHQFVISQEHVAWLLGKGGSTVKGIQQKSGARISVEQGVPESGQSTVRIKGQPLEVMTARMLIGRSLAGHGAREVPHGELRVEQELVAWLLGVRGAVLSEIEESTGTTILLDQSTQDLGYSTVRILGRPGPRREAMDLIKTSLDSGRKAILKPGLSEPKPLTGVRKKRGGWTDPTKRIEASR